jgi:hypothetical protein
MSERWDAYEQQAETDWFLQRFLYPGYRREPDLTHGQSTTHRIDSFTHADCVDVRLTIGPLAVVDTVPPNPHAALVEHARQLGAEIGDVISGTYRPAGGRFALDLSTVRVAPKGEKQ